MLAEPNQQWLNRKIFQLAILSLALGITQRETQEMTSFV